MGKGLLKSSLEIINEMQVTNFKSDISIESSLQGYIALLLEKMCKRGEYPERRNPSFSLLGLVLVGTLFAVTFSGQMNQTSYADHPYDSQRQYDFPVPQQNLRTTYNTHCYLNAASNCDLYVNQVANTDTNTAVDITLGAKLKESEASTVQIVSEPFHGLLSDIDRNTSVVTYTPDDGFSGVDEFIFKVGDKEADSSNTARVLIQVG